MNSDINEKLKEIQNNIHVLPMHLYILLWAISDMSDRFKKSPKNPKFCEIKYPFSPVPLFDKDEASSLEDLWRKNIEGKDIFAEADEQTNTETNKKQKKQEGGRVKLPSLAEMKGKATQFGQSLKIAVDTLDAKKISPDYLYGYTTDLFDSMDSALTQASGTFGIVALESTMPDPVIGAIPTVPPVPIMAPAKSVFPVINAVLEVLRIMAGASQLLDPLGLLDPFGLAKLSRIVLTLVMFLLDIARGNLYHAIFTSFGFIGSMPMFLGIALKIVRDALMLVSPDIRKDLRDLLFKSSKSFFVGFCIWLFTVMSPQFVKKPISALFEAVAIQLDTINQQIDTAEMNANMGPISAVATIKLPRIPGDKIPDINNLYALREAIREPAIYCDPKISQLMDELREVPPYALFFDMALIPKTGSTEFNKMCAPFGGASFSDNLSRLAAPQIIPLGSDTPLPIAPIPNPVSPADIQLQPTVAPVSETAGLKHIAEGAVSDVLAKSPLGPVLGSNPLQTLANPQEALTKVAESTASDMLAKSPVGPFLGANPIKTLTNPQEALQHATEGTASALIAKSPVGPLLSQTPQKALATALKV